MRYKELVDRVQEQGELESADQAEKAIKATLSTLGECLYRTERRHLASQLPQEAKGFLYEYADPQVQRRESACFTLQEFYGRVGARTDATYAHAVRRAQTVVSVLNELLPARLRKSVSPA